MLLRACSIGVLIGVAAAGCLRDPNRGARGAGAPRKLLCKAGPAMKYVLQVDGVNMGVFSAFETRGNTVVVRDGIFIGKKFVDDWRAFNLANPIVRERHDLVLFEAGEKTSTPVAELVNAQLLDAQGVPATDDVSCLVLESFTVQAEAIRKPTGVVLPIR